MLKSKYPFKPVLRSKSPANYKRSTSFVSNLSSKSKSRTKKNKRISNSSKSRKRKRRKKKVEFVNTKEKENESPRFNNKQREAKTSRTHKNRSIFHKEASETFNTLTHVDYTFAPQHVNQEESLGKFGRGKEDPGYKPTLGHLIHKLNYMR